MTEDRLYSRSPDVASAAMGEELAVMDLKSGTYIAFNRTATEIWNLLEEPRTLGAISAILAERYALALGECQADIAELLQQLISKGLVR